MQPKPEDIKEARKARKLSQNDVADAIGLPRSTYAVKEKTGDFSREEWKKIIDFLEIQPDKPTKKPDSQDYRDELIESLRDQVQMLKDKLNTNLVVMEERQKAVAAMIRVTLQNVEQLRSGGDEKKAAKIQADNDKLILELAKTVK